MEFSGFGFKSRSGQLAIATSIATNAGSFSRSIGVKMLKVNIRR